MTKIIITIVLLVTSQLFSQGQFEQGMGKAFALWGEGKNKRISEILKAGHDVLIEIDSLHETDESALKREAFLIFEYGTVTKKTGCLLNVTVEKVKRWKRIKGNLWKYE